MLEHHTYERYINQAITYLSTGDAELDLTTVSAHESSELLADTLEGAQTVVLGQSSEEVLQNVTLVGTGNLLELGNDLLLVGVGEGWGTEDSTQLLVGLQGLAEAGDSLGGLVEGSGLGGSSVLEDQNKVRQVLGYNFLNACGCGEYIAKFRVRIRHGGRRGDASSEGVSGQHDIGKKTTTTKSVSHKEVEFIPEQWRRCRQRRKERRGGGLPGPGWHRCAGC